MSERHFFQLLLVELTAPAAQSITNQPAIDVHWAAELMRFLGAAIVEELIGR